MEKHVMVVMSNPVEGRDDAFNEWYDSVHIPELLDIPGFVRAERYDVGSATGHSNDAFRYLAIYHIEGDCGAAQKALAAATLDLSEAPAKATSMTYTLRQ
jgi:hypothetical protein